MRPLVLVYVRLDPVRRDDIFIGLRLVALRAGSGERDAHAHWSMRMEARSAGGGYVSAEYAVYDSNPARGEGARRPFRADAGGVLEWLDFTEPDDKDDHGGYPYNWSPEMETTAARLGLSGTKREVMMDLVLTQLGSGETVRLPGPTVRIPNRIWHAEPPKPKTLGLFDALNPFEKGSIWQWLGRGARYRDCIKERRAAKRAFARHS